MRTLHESQWLTTGSEGLFTVLPVSGRGGCLLIFAQGALGIVDILIHPHYVSSVSPLTGGPFGLVVLIAFIVSIIGLLYFLYQTLNWRGRRMEGERAKRLWLERRFP